MNDEEYSFFLAYGVASDYDLQLQEILSHYVHRADM